MLYEPDKILNIDLSSEVFPEEMTIGRLAEKIVKGAGTWLKGISGEYGKTGPFPMLMRLTGEGKNAVSLAKSGLSILADADTGYPKMRRNLHMDLLLSNPVPGLGDYSLYGSADFSKMKGVSLTALYTVKAQKPAASTPQALYGAERIIITAENDPLLADETAPDKLRNIPEGLYIEDADGNLKAVSDGAEAKKLLKDLANRYKEDPMFLLQSDRMAVIENVVKQWVKAHEAAPAEERTDAEQQQFEKQFAKAVSDLQPSLITDTMGVRYSRHEPAGKKCPTILYFSGGTPTHVTEVTILPMQSQAAYSVMYPPNAAMSAAAYRAELLSLTEALTKTGSKGSKEYKALMDACENALLAAQTEEMERQKMNLLMDVSRTLHEEAGLFASLTESCLEFLGDDHKSVYRLGIAKSIFSLTEEGRLDQLEKSLLNMISGSQVAKVPPISWIR